MTSDKNLGDLIPRRKLYQDVVERLVDMIHSQKLTPGTPLPSERDLILRFGVGRPALREAFVTLENLGLIKLSNGRPARVAAPTPSSALDQLTLSAQHLLASSEESLQDLKSARLFFEVGMVRAAAEQASTNDIARLSSIIQEMRISIKNPTIFQQLDLEFHVAISEVSKNSILTAVSRSMLKWLWNHHSKLVILPGAERLTLSEHRAILREIKARHPDNAAKAITQHITRADELYWQHTHVERDSSKNSR